jgi:GMP synthase-like glutamine amidotransferase
MMPPVRILLVGLWVDEVPAGCMPVRIEPLGMVAAEMGFRIEVIHRRDLDAKPWLADPPAGMVLSGSRLHLGEDCTLADFPALTALLDGLPQVPVLGLCFGHQFLNVHAGGRLDRFGKARRDADWPVRRCAEHAVFTGLPDPCPFGENHVQRVVEPGRGYRIIATSDDGIEAVAHDTLPRLGVQFHPEYFPEQAVPHGRVFLGNWFRSLNQAESRSASQRREVYDDR